MSIIKNKGTNIFSIKYVIIKVKKTNETNELTNVVSYLYRNRNKYRLNKLNFLKQYRYVFLNFQSLN